MAESKSDRVKATRLRKEVALGKKLSDANQKWLDAYTTRTTIASARARSGAPPAASSKPAAPPVVRGPQLSLVGDGPVSSAVQQTVPLSDAIDPNASTWTPTMPEAPADAPPPPPGSPPPPAAGTPLVDDSAPPPQGGIKTAAIVAGLVDAILTAGLQATDELFAGVKLPEMLRAGLDNAKAREELHKEVQAAAARMSIKRGWAFADGVASDEGMVVGVVVLSGAAIFANRARQKKLAGGSAANVNANKPNPDAAPEYGSKPGDADAVMRDLHAEKGFAS